MDAKTIKGMLEGATAKWARQRKAEERHASARANRHVIMTGARKITIKQAANQVMSEAYMKASAGGTLPAPARMIFYAARPLIQALTGEPLKGSDYFTKTLLPAYLDENPRQTQGWRVAWDARGHLVEPHTRRSVPLGTIDVATYLRDVGEPQWHDPQMKMPEIDTCGPTACYNAILFIEKEGFNEIFEAVRLAEKWDLAIMSTKGTSVTSARFLADELCSKCEIPLFVLHDFDKVGLNILKTLREDTWRYTFSNRIKVIDLGLRLADVIAEGLEGEDVVYESADDVVMADLRRSGATVEEISFLLKQRVELNEFTADVLVEWLEDKLEQHGMEKVIPNHEMLTEAYRREKQSIYLRPKIEALLKESEKHVADLEMPDDLAERLGKLFESEPELSWNEAVAKIATS